MGVFNSGFVGGGGSGGVSGLDTADAGVAIADDAILVGDGTSGIQGNSSIYISKVWTTLDSIWFGGGSTDPVLYNQSGEIWCMRKDETQLYPLGGNAFKVYNDSFQNIGFFDGNNKRLSLGSDWKLGFSSSTTSASSAEVFFSRQQSNVIGVRSNQATPISAAFLSNKLVEVNTAGVGSPNVLVGLESGTVITNEGVTAKNYNTLPTAVAGYVFEFVNMDTDGLRITCASGDNIAYGGGAVTTSTGGYLESTTQYSTVRLLAVNADNWVITSFTGVWTDGTFTITDASLYAGA